MAQSWAQPSPGPSGIRIGVGSQAWPSQKQWPWTTRALLRSSAEEKLREWLQRIPVGDGRGWDDAQIVEIAEFAFDANLEHLSAEDIYAKFVEHKVKEAEND